MSDSPPPKKRACWRIPASEMSRNTINPIRRIIDGLKLTPNPAKEMIPLSIGDPTVFGNLLPPKEMCDALYESALSNKYHGYAPSVGQEKARQAVAAYVSTPELTVEAKDVILTSGCSSAIDLCISVLANPGQNILIPSPGFSLYKTLGTSIGVEIRPYRLLPDKSWEIDLLHMESLINANTAAIVVNNPSNPCGSVYSREHLEAIMEVAHIHKVPIIADEIYAHFVFPGNTFNYMATLTTDVPILSCGGLTKRFIVPGWRLGWIVVYDRHDAFAEIRPGLVSLSQRILGPNTVVQGAMETILTKIPESFFEETIAAVQKNAELFYDAFSKIPGLKPVMPQGAMYMMVGIEMDKFGGFKTEMEFLEKLVTEQSVFCLPGSCFNLADYFRVVLTVPEDKAREACDRITEYCSEHYCDNPTGTSNGGQEDVNNH